MAMDPKADKMFAEMVNPGEVWLTSGFKGGGKSHTAIAVAEQLVKGMYPSVGRVYLLTNIIFYHKVKGKLKVECPPNVYHVETMKDTFWKIYEILREAEHEGRDKKDVKILWVLDEAQNFIGGDRNGGNASIMMKELLGTIRKFRLIVWFLTPSAQAIGPAFRNWLTDPKYPGNLTAKWKKDLGWNAQYIEKHKLKLSPKELMIVKHFDSPAKLVQVPITEWTKTKETIKNGEYCYDHEASATFYVGDGFEWEDFNKVLGGAPAITLLDTIERYYNEKVFSAPQESDEKEAENDAILEIACTLRVQGMKWDSIANIVKIPRKTLTDRIKRAGMWSEDLENVGQGGKNDNPAAIRRNDASPSTLGGGDLGDEKLPANYISREEGGLNEVSESRPAEKGADNNSIDNIDYSSLSVQEQLRKMRERNTMQV